MRLLTAVIVLVILVLGIAAIRYLDDQAIAARAQWTRVTESQY